MNRVGKIKQLIATVVELSMLLLLLESLENGGMGLLLGSTFGSVATQIIGFGVSIIGIFGLLLGVYLPTRRFDLFRETQTHILKYTTVLSLFQLLGFCITKASGVIVAGAVVGLNPYILNALVMTFCMIALMMPFNYVKSLFGVLKAVKYRDPRRINKQFFF